MSLKKILPVLFIIEAILIVFSVISGAKQAKNEALPVMEYAGVIEKDEDSGTFSLPEGYPEDSRKTAILSLNFGKLPKGSYRGIIRYSGNRNGEQELSFSSSGTNAIKANPLILDPFLDQAVFDITLTQTVNNFTIRLDSRQCDDFTAGIELTRSGAETGRRIFTIVLIFSLLETALISYTKQPRMLTVSLILLLIAAAAFIPYGLKGIKPGHDFSYHFLRIEGLVQEMRNGQFPVYMESLWVGDHGYPVSLYYSDVFLYIPAVLRLIGFSVEAAFKMFVFLINILTALIAFRSFRKIFRKEQSALLLAFVYTCSPYRLMDIYVRSSVGEFCAITFLPLICAGFYEICVTAPGPGREKLRAFLPGIFDLSIGMSGVFLSHLLTTEMALILLVLVSLILWKTILKPMRIAAILLAALCTLLMCLVFLVPFTDFLLSNETEIRMGMEREVPAIQQQGVQPGELFLFTKEIFGSGANNGMEDRMYLSTGMTLMLTVIIAIFVLIGKKGSRQLLLFTGMAWLCLFLSSTLFPWDSLARQSRIGVLLAQIQFPWRYLTFASLFSVLVLGELIRMAIPFLEPISEKISGRTDLLLYAALSLTGFLLFTEVIHIASDYGSAKDRMELYNPNEIRLSDVPAYHILRHGTDPEYYYYEPVGENVTIETLEKQGTSWRIRAVTGESEGIVTMPLNNYEGFRAVGEDGREFRVLDGENKAVSFRLPARYDGIIEVAFRPAWYWPVSAIISAVSFALLVILRLSTGRRSGFRA